MYSGFGAASPFLPSFIESRGMPVATETGLKDLSEKDRLDDYAVVQVATGELQRLTEPGLGSYAAEQRHQRS